MSYVVLIAENYENQLGLDAEMYGPFNSEEEADEWMRDEIARRERPEDWEPGDEEFEFMGHAFAKPLLEPEGHVPRDEDDDDSYEANMDPDKWARDFHRKKGHEAHIKEGVPHDKWCHICEPGD